MKKIINLLGCLSFLLATFVATSCSNDDNANSSSNPPTITSVSASADEEGQPLALTPTSVGYANNVYIINGSGFSSLQHVYFNDFESYFNPNFVTDNTIFVTINTNTPYANGSNKLKVVTKNGTAEFDFVIAPPSPIVTGYNSINAANGDQIKIKGNYFVNPVVKIGNNQATIVSSTLTEIIATLPNNSQGNTVSVSTLSGTATYYTQIGTAFYDDILYGSTVNSGWGETHDTGYSEDASNVKQGDKSIKLDISAWSGFQFDNAPAFASTANGIRFFAKAKTSGTQNMQVMINYNWNDRATIDITNEFKEFRIPWSTFGLSSAPTGSSSNIIFFNQGTANIYYIDDLGYYN
ncbi:MAG: hypothetical protein O9267_04915 [Flavobacterium sp.]|uniref:IPT/TIG domain-containing protein n=1 Tax=Flavobacterium sp. TaxID=239 RepID=UPI0022C23EC2|nr:IPT/TIG domain-containing protein [Flavobacterium sp.]MCZ8196927.1 hypothetical protein [Flavobacterium sp.]